MRALWQEAGATVPVEAPTSADPPGTPTQSRSSDPPTICLPHEYFKISPDMWEAVMGVLPTPNL